MRRLLEIASPNECPQHLRLTVGDVLLCRSMGGRVQNGAGVLDVIGSLRSAVVGTQGELMVPEAPPDIFMCRAAGVGECQLQLVFGVPRGMRETVTIAVVVSP
jgi:hypothetical protein